MPNIIMSYIIITARKRSLRRLCFHRCLSVHEGLCPEGCFCPGGGVYLGGLCPGGLSGGSVQGVSVWGSLCPGGVLSRGVSVTETPRYSNERAVRILLECILVVFHFNVRFFSKFKLELVD